MGNDGQLEAWSNAFWLPVVCLFGYDEKLDRDEKHDRGQGKMDAIGWHRDSANFKLAWFALAALAVLCISLCAS